jgi:hypothetical protein
MSYDLLVDFSKGHYTKLIRGWEVFFFIHDIDFPTTDLLRFFIFTSCSFTSGYLQIVDHAVSLS